jgi:transposase
VSQRPQVCRTWSPRGQTPIVQYSFQWKTLSAIAGLTWWNFYFQLYPCAIRSPQVIQFLAALTQHIAGPLLIVWDRLPSHRSKLVQQFVTDLGGWIHLEYLPPYAPELNPVEYIWAYWKHHELPNVCPKDFWELGEVARQTLRRMRRRPRLITAFWKQADLSLE